MEIAPADQSGHPGAQILAAIIVVVVIVGLGLLTHGGFRGLFVGKDNRMSTSKTTALLWTVFVLFAFTTELIVALSHGGSALTDLQTQLKSVPSNTYLLLLGGPFAALVAAKGIVTSRLANGTLQKVSAASPTINPADLISDDAGQTDLVDLQFLLFNLVALAFAFGLFARHPLMGLPPIPDGLAALTSVGALAYIGNKAVSEGTPLLQTLTPSVARPGERVVINGANLVPAHDTNDGDVVTTPVVTVGGALALILQDPPPTASQLTIRVPDACTAGVSVPVTVTTASDTPGTASTTLTVEADTITLTSLAPSSVRPGDTVTLLGHNFLDPHADQPLLASAPEVIMGGIAAEIIPNPAPANNQISVRVPAELTGSAAVTVHRGTAISQALPLTLIAPSINSVEWQPLADTGDFTLTIHGSGLPPQQGTVALNGTSLDIAQGNTTTRMTVHVPNAQLPPAGPPVTVTVTDAVGQVANFPVARPAGI